MTRRKRRSNHRYLLTPPVPTSLKVRRHEKNPNNFGPLLIQVGCVVGLVLGWAAYSLNAAATPPHNRVRIEKRNRMSTQQRPHHRLPTATPPGLNNRPWPSSTAATALVQAFQERYGVDYSETLWQRGLWRPEDNLASVASSTTFQSSFPFHAVVLGNGGPAGYGNVHAQAYPSLLEGLLNDYNEESHNNEGQANNNQRDNNNNPRPTWKVTNLAGYEWTEFPLLWCGDHFFTHDNKNTPVDLVVWDYGREASIARLEAFLRHLHRRGVPRVVIRHTFREAAVFDLVQHYRPWFADITVVMDGYAVQDIFDNDNESLPSGLAEWDTFGDTGGSPDKMHPHLSLQEHELVARLLALHLVDLMETNNGIVTSAPRAPLPSPLWLSNTTDPWVLASTLPTTSQWTCYTGLEHVARDSDLEALPPHILPPGMALVPTNLPALLNSDKQSIWIDTSSHSLLQPKGAQFFHQGWVYDLDATTKKHRQRTRHVMDDSHNYFGGFTDWKTALYGVAASGILRLTIPLTHVNIQRFVVCQADDPLVVGGCTASKDLQFTSAVDGTELASSIVEAGIVKTARGDKPLCLDVSLPANLTHTNYFSVNVQVKNDRLRWNLGPCSISHVIVQTSTETTVEA